jgi:hypothetical protein
MFDDLYFVWSFENKKKHASIHFKKELGIVNIICYAFKRGNEFQ